MALVINCNACHKKFKIPEKAATRIDLEQISGEYFRKTCLHCCVEKEYHINDVEAEADHTAKIISASVGIGIIFLVTLFAWGKGLVTNAGLVIGGAIIAAGWMAGSSTDNFNQYKTNRSRDVERDRQIREEMKYRKGDTNFEV